MVRSGDGGSVGGGTSGGGAVVVVTVMVMMKDRECFVRVLACVFFTLVIRCSKFDFEGLITNLA